MFKIQRAILDHNQLNFLSYAIPQTTVWSVFMHVGKGIRGWKQKYQRKNSRLEPWQMFCTASYFGYSQKTRIIGKQTVQAHESISAQKK